jgi:hypothetical protein
MPARIAAKMGSAVGRPVSSRRRRELATARKRRYRANLAAGQVVVRVVVSNQ